jgi:GntR family transcriptional repressor for pyruvate dehydrogenase complex
MSLNFSRRKLPDMVSEAIVKFILKETLKPGDKLPTEKELSQLLGIGRTSLREGIRQLETVGLLSSHQGKGVYLREVTLDSLFASGKHIPMASFLKLNKQEILDWLSVRLVFESEACRLAAERITDEELAALQKIHQCMSNSVSNREEFIAQAVNFHKQILLSSGNAILSKLYEFIEDLYSKQISIFMNFPQAMQHSLFYHGEILQALIERNVRAAVKNLKAHIEDVKKAVIENFDTL